MSEIKYRVGVYAYGASSTAISLAVFSVLCPTAMQRVVQNSVPMLSAKVCGGGNPAHGQCQVTTAGAQCHCNAGFVLNDCSGVADPVKIYPEATGTDPAHFQHLQVGSVW